MIGAKGQAAIDATKKPKWSQSFADVLNDNPKQAPVDFKGKAPPSVAPMAKLNLTPQETHLYAHHLNNLATGNYVKNSDGSTSTLLQTTIDVDGKTYNLPTVWGGKILTDPNDIVDHAVKAGGKEGIDYWPSYPDEDTAQARYDKMHDALALDVGMSTKVPPPNLSPADTAPAAAIPDNAPPGNVPQWQLDHVDNAIAQAQAAH